MDISSKRSLQQIWQMRLQITITQLIEVLTGFKYIGQQILGFETSKKGEYLFGFEESYGCLIGTHARDKDAIVATMALCEQLLTTRQKT